LRVGASTTAGSTRVGITASAILGLAARFSLAQTQPEPPPPVIRADTRLVEVEVVLRNKDGPVAGLTRDDFTLQDQGTRRTIAVFRAGALGGEPPSGAGQKPGASRGPGISRSGRTDHPVAGATVLLLDLLNTSLDNQDYARTQLLKALESADTGEHIAIYMLGKNLSLVQDLAANREAAAQALRKWDPKDLSLLIQNTENMDPIDRAMQCTTICQEIRTQTTAQAIAKIVQNLAGIAGRKSLVWVSDTPGRAGSELLGAANIHLYPVLARSVGTSGVVGWMRDTREALQAGLPSGTATPPMASGNEIDRQHANAALAAASGGVAFMDSRDISTAVRTAIEDAGNTYVLGFYPAEETLDNRFHVLTVEVAKRVAVRDRTLDIRYRPGYFAARTAPPARAPENTAPANDSAVANAAKDRPTLNQLLQNPPGTSALYFTAEPSPDPERPDALRIKVHVDAHDLAQEREHDMQSLGVDISFHVEGSGKVMTKTLKFQIPDSQLSSFLEKGIDTVESIDPTGTASALSVVVQDRVAGTAGSVIVPLGQR
jgi:VWFA-related protein